MEQLNRVELKGIVGNVRIQTYDENKMARIGLATNFAYKDREGTAVIDTSWHNVIAWEGRNIQGLDKIEKGPSCTSSAASVTRTIRAWTASTAWEQTSWPVRSK